ncbi:MAG: cyclase [Thermoplasmata archaeon]|nr:cyclase [Thermoplasmata archaeon]
MVYALVRHGVEDYAKWKTAFDEHGEVRMGFGSQGGWLFRTSEDANDLVILLRYEDPQKLDEFLHSEDLKEVMEGAGVQGEPEILILEQLEEVPI